jgi:hypothetical protein
MKRSPIQPGERFGRLVAIARTVAGSKKAKEAWLCACDCGTNKELRSSDLKAGKIRSCGCLRREITSSLSKARVKHAGAGTPEHRAWIEMRRRCRPTKHLASVHYTGRGIQVCERWQTFKNFLTDMGPRPSPKHSIDRIDNDGNYEPKNCRWATATEQIRNRTNTRLVSFNGESLTIKEWCERLGLDYVAMKDRLRHGWSPERAFTEPVRHRVRPKALARGRDARQEREAS